MTHNLPVASRPSSNLNRRRFLAASAAGISAAAISATGLGTAMAQAQPPKPKWPMKLSTSSLHYRSLPLAESCQRIGALGFEAVDVWSHFEWAGPVCEHLEEGLEKLGVEGFAALLNQHKLKLFAASCYSTSAARFAPLLGKLGGAVIIRGSRGLQGTAATVTTAELKTQMGAFLESLKPELDLLGQHHCALAIENHSGHSLLNTLDSIKIFADLNKHPQLGVALAPYHVQINGESVEQSIGALGDQLRFFYAWQHGEGTKQLPGIGPTDMAPWLRELAAVNYQGYVNAFMHHEPEPDEMDKALKTTRAYLLKTYQELTA